MKQVQEHRGQAGEGESFMVMHYQCKTCRAIELVWNSREGVVPFIINTACCENSSAQHVSWQSDSYSPSFPEGTGVSRVFVNVTREKADAMARDFMRKFGDDMMVRSKDQNFDEEQAAAQLADRYYGDGRQPTLVSVEEYKAQASPTEPAPYLPELKWDALIALQEAQAKMYRYAKAVPEGDSRKAAMAAYVALSNINLGE